MRQREELLYQTVLAIYQLLNARLIPRGSVGTEVSSTSCQEITGYSEDELMTVKEACAEMNVSRGTIYKKIRDGKLDKVKRDGPTRLIRKEVEAAKIWYSVPKGKL